MENLKFLPGTGRGTTRRVVEGQALHVLDDRRNDSFRASQNLGSGNPEDGYTARRQPPIPRLIALRTITAAVRFAVDFHREPQGSAIEVEHIGSGGMLSSKLMSARTFSKFAPQQTFRQAQFATKFSRVAYGRSWSVQHRACPSTMLRPRLLRNRLRALACPLGMPRRYVPLPVPGRNFSI